MTPLFSPPPKKTDGVVFFSNKKKVDREKKRNKMPGVKKNCGEDFVEPSDLDRSEIRWSPV